MPAASGAGHLFGVTVTVGSLMTLAAMVGMVVYVFHSANEAEPAVVQAIEGPDELYLRLTQGGPLRLADLQLSVDTARSEGTVELATYENDLGTHWNPGENVCIAGPAGHCATRDAKDDLVGVTLREGSKVLLVWTPTALVETPPPTGFPAEGPEEANGTADLQAWLVGPDPDALEPDRPMRWTARVANNGTADTTGSFNVSFYLDGELLNRRDISPLQAEGMLQVMSATWVPTPGLHTLVIVVDEAGAVDDLDRANNRYTIDFVVER